MKTAEKIAALLVNGGCSLPLARLVSRAAVALAVDPPRREGGEIRNIDWPTRAFALALKIEQLRGDDNGHREIGTE